MSRETDVRDCAWHTVVADELPELADIRPVGAEAMAFVADPFAERSKGVYAAWRSSGTFLAIGLSIDVHLRRKMHSGNPSNSHSKDHCKCKRFQLTAADYLV